MTDTVTIPRTEWNELTQRLASIEGITHVIVHADATYRAQVTALVDSVREASREFYLPASVIDALDPLLPKDAAPDGGDGGEG